MSQPAARYIRQRTTDCPTCGARRGRPCWRLDETNLDKGSHVSPHAARLVAEKALKERAS